MKRTITALLLALALVGTLSSCGAPQGSLKDALEQAGALAQTQTQTQNGRTDAPGQQAQEPVQVPEPEAEAVPGSGNTDVYTTTGDGDTVGTSSTMTVSGDTGEMTISRPEPEQVRSMGEPGTWTIFVYLCGSDLESGLAGGLASLDLDEMCQAAPSDKVRFVVQTGGALDWHNSAVSANRCQRFVVDNGRLNKIYETPRTGMGQTKTLSAFLTWGVANYPAERMGVILWNHGGGSVNGVCFDEMEDWDSLSLRELDAALLSVYGTMTDRFEFIGFDACLMGTLETANILATYARYMIGSQESEPGSGWDYKTMGDTLARHPEYDGRQLGRVICESFYEQCRQIGCEGYATLSVIDLEQVDPLVQSFNTFAESMYTASEDSAVLAEMVRGIRQAENFGGNNWADGYTNMVDLGGLISACADSARGADEALAALGRAVVCNVTGYVHPGASGLSLYYPLQVQGSSEMSTFTEICVSPFYLSFVDRQSYGSVNGGDTGSYSDHNWFGADGGWTASNDYGVDGSTGWFDYDADQSQWGDYWDYIDDFEQTGQSPLITFAVEPHLDQNGRYTFTFDQNGWENAAYVKGLVYELSEDGEDLLELGQTADVGIVPETYYVQSVFDGRWLSLPDGQNLALYIVELTEDHVIYSSPIELNGQDTNLRLYQDHSSVTIEGAWSGMDGEYGYADREMIQLKPGDRIVPRYYAYSLHDDWEGEYVGHAYTVTEEMAVSYDYMDAGEYYYVFEIDDIFGDYYLSDGVSLIVEDGRYYFYE